MQEWRIEVNFVRLLYRCENMASKKNCLDHWRLKVFFRYLEEQLAHLKKMSANQPSEEALLEYSSRLDFLRRILEAEKLKSCSLISQAIDKINEQTMIPSTDFVANESKLSIRKFHSQIRAQHHDDVRNELFSTKRDGLIQLRNRKEIGDKSQAEDIVKYHQEKQEELAKEMVKLARNLKENASTAGSIVKRDNQELIKANELAGLNMDQLKIESERLEQYLASACNCWLWVSMLIVCITFVSMVIFMKLFPKPQS